MRRYAAIGWLVNVATFAILENFHSNPQDSVVDAYDELRIEESKA